MANAKFTVLFEKMRGTVFELTRETTSVGRRDGMDICIKDSSVSGHHADIIRTQRGSECVYVLRDNDSTNGTRVNDHDVTEVELHNSDLVFFGGVEMLFDSGDGNTDLNSGFQPTVTLDFSENGSLAEKPQLSNYNPLLSGEMKKSKQANQIITGIIVVSALAVAGIIGWVLVQLFK